MISRKYHIMFLAFPSILDLSLSMGEKIELFDKNGVYKEFLYATEVMKFMESYPAGCQFEIESTTITYPETEVS